MGIEAALDSQTTRDQQPLWAIPQSLNREASSLIAYTAGIRNCEEPRD